MRQEDGQDVDDAIADLPLEEAIEVVLGREGMDEAERADVRADLDHVADDGVVSWDAAAEELAHVSKVVATPETRLEFASMAVADAREAAASVPDLDVVRVRLEELDASLSGLEREVDELGERLRTVVTRCEKQNALYAVGRDLRTLTTEAERLHGAIEDLRMDAEDLESWLKSHDVRRRELADDADVLADSLDDLTDAVDSLEDAVESETQDETAEILDASDITGMGSIDDLGVVWYDATLRQRMLGLLISDLRAELDALRVMATDDGDGSADGISAVETRLDDLQASTTTLGERLATIARSAWRDRFDDRLRSFETVIDDMEPPVDWAQVEGVLENHSVDAQD